MPMWHHESTRTDQAHIVRGVSPTKGWLMGMEMTAGSLPCVSLGGKWASPQHEQHTAPNIYPTPLP